MTNIIKHSDGNLNDIRAYPFADTSSRRADNGEILPEYILNDCNIWWPDVYGSECFLSAATLSPGLLTLAFSVVTPNGSITPLGVASINRLENYASTKIIGTIPGVGGWVVIGSLPENINFVKTWKFSNYKNSLILARLAQGYPIYPVISLGKEGSQKVLFDTITFLAGTNLQITKGERIIEGQLQECIIFSLREDLLPELYKVFAGPCGKRPESKTCEASPIKKINNVEPDFNGVLYLDIDNSKGIVDGEIIDTGSGTKGIALLTPIDYLDVCTEQKFDILPSDLCDSSLSASDSDISGGGQSHSAGIGDSSSSLSLISKFYDFVDPKILSDWSFFERNDIHAIDWEASSNIWGISTSPKYLDNKFVIPFEIFGATATSRHLFLNNYKYSLVEENDIVSILLNFSLNGEDLNQLAVGDKRNIILKFTDSNFLNFTNGRLFEAVLEIERVNVTTVQLTTSLKLFNGTDFITLASGQTRTFTLSCSSSSATTFCNDFSFSVYFEDKLVSLDTSGTGHDIHHLKLIINSETHYSLDVDLANSLYNDNNYEYRNIQFIDIEFQTVGVGNDPQPNIDCIIESITIQALHLNLQGCLEPNADNDLISRVPYKLFYEPNIGWSNDFGTARAINQFQLLPSKNGITFQFLTRSNSDLVYQKQYLEKQLAGYKYGILTCESSSVDQYIYSFAFKATSTTVRVGLLLGWQNTQDDVFWALVIDPNARRLAYGIHHLPHTFQPNLWVNIPDTDSDWPFEWHRLVVKMTLNITTNTYELNAWIDPVFNSSSAAGVSKTISIDFNNPLYSLTGITPWDGSTFSASMFADGPPGFFVYLGSARIAEYTVSPVDQDIIIPNKVPWLSL